MTKPRNTTHLEHQHTILIEGAIDRVFPLFTPIGETLWVEGWTPEFIYPASGETCEGMIFRTSHDDEETLWSCVHWNPDQHQVRYARVTPGSRFGFVEVACQKISPQQTKATVSYIFTALGPAGSSYLSEMTSDAYVRTIDEWRIRIERWLNNNADNPPAIAMRSFV